jgi:hypothetical protein
MLLPPPAMKAVALLGRRDAARSIKANIRGWRGRVRFIVNGEGQYVMQRFELHVRSTRLDLLLLSIHVRYLDVQIEIRLLLLSICVKVLTCAVDIYTLV